MSSENHALQLQLALTLTATRLKLGPKSAFDSSVHGGWFLPANSTSCDRMDFTTSMNSKSREPRSTNMACLVLRLTLRGPGVNSFFSRMLTASCARYSTTTTKSQDETEQGGLAVGLQFEKQFIYIPADSDGLSVNDIPVQARTHNEIKNFEGRP